MTEGSAPRPYGPGALIVGATLGAGLTLALMFVAKGLPEDTAPAAVDEVEPPGVAPARAYPELVDRGPRTPSFDALLETMPLSGARESAASREQWRERRRQRRAFEGAPPVVPHGISERSSASCLVCHELGMAFPAGDRASVISHDLLTPCTQCHVPAESGVVGVDPELAEARFGGSGFEGLVARAGPRAAPGAPPMIPHTTWMRERCDACHGAAGPNPLRTEHPERSHCGQCHATSSTLEQHPHRP